ncbi:MAG TPA: PilZ domain-containing protein [Candidatus Sulfotelmatobacter sp.]|nr:PilZ domain-containing protein [Candidatus Sulfotelmatobacter sp.]
MTRRSTRVRVEIPVSVISLDRKRPFGEKCTVLVVSAQGCGFRASEELQLETPIMLSGLPGGGSVTARVANCLPLGKDGQYFLIGASLYTHGNVWGIADPPADWDDVAKDDPVASRPKTAAADAPKLTVNKKVWPYNLFSEGAELHPGRK